MTGGPLAEDVDPSRLRTVLIAVVANLLVAVRLLLVIAGRPRSVHRGRGHLGHAWCSTIVRQRVLDQLSCRLCRFSGIGSARRSVPRTADRPAPASYIGLCKNSFDYALNGSNTSLRAVLVEDAAALIGLTIAAVGIFLHEVSGAAAYDAIGSILIGVLLGVVAVVLIDRNRQYLLGSSPLRNSVARSARLCLPDQRSNAVPTYISNSPVQASCTSLPPLTFLATGQKIKSRRSCAELGDRSRRVCSSRLPC